jgi:outer membrane protein OmpA-like peptidoglycan-associated protein
MKMKTALIALLTSILGVAQAQSTNETFDFELFRPSADHYGYFAVPSAATLGHLQVGGGFWVNYQNDPIILVSEDVRIAPKNAEVVGDNGEGIVDDRLTGNVQIGFGLSRYFSLSVDAPLVLWQDGYLPNKNIVRVDNVPDRLIVSGIGDVRVTPKVVALDRDRLPIGMSVAMPVGLPTGNGGSFLGEEGVSLTPTTIFEFSDGPIRSRKYSFRSAVMAGYHVRPGAQIRDVPVNSAVVYGVAMGLHSSIMEIIGEFHGSIWGDRAAQQPAEVLGGVKVLAGEYVSLNFGGGMGVLPGLGSPDWRIFGGVSVAPSFDPNMRDTDKDGIMDAMDRCIREAEDLDNFQDEDGCPDKDNDADGLLDTVDRCPLQPEDEDGFQDGDGCADPDNDKDGILDVSDRCPNEPESNNGYQDEDGCPDTVPVLDTDGDGYNDDVDRCPYDAEDFDGVEDEDGCPDKDVVIEKRVVIEKNFIKITEKIYFEFGKADIQERSFSLVDEIAEIVLENPQLKKIRIEGHTDDVGSDVANLRLSQARADSVVRAISDRGVNSNRLDAVGFGEMRPIDANETDDGRAANRRVEFIIVDQE